MSMKGIALGAMLTAANATTASAQADIGVCHVQDIKTASFTHVTMDENGGMAGFQKSNGEKFEINLSVLEDNVIGNGFEPSDTRKATISEALEIMNADMIGMSNGGEVYALINNEWEQLKNFETQLLDNGNDKEFMSVSTAGSAVARIGASINHSCEGALLQRNDAQLSLK